MITPLKWIFFDITHFFVKHENESHAWSEFSNNTFVQSYIQVSIESDENELPVVVLINFDDKTYYKLMQGSCQSQDSLDFQDISGEIGLWAKDGDRSNFSDF